MNGAQFRISWDSYLKQVSEGFSVLQQNAEFVDMTLAADGHLVKVHQNIIAVASPYLKAMLQSASCPHPVIFLNDVSHEILSYILTYVYIGEVKLPIHLIGKFIDACKSLRIRGVDKIDAPKGPQNNLNIPNQFKQPDPATERINLPDSNTYAAQITINTQDDNNCNIELENNAYNVNLEKPLAQTAPVSDVPECVDSAVENTAIKVNNDDKLMKTINVNNIDKFIIMKPTQNESNNMTIMSDLTLNLNDWQTDLNNINDQPIENPVKNITVISDPTDMTLNPIENTESSLNSGIISTVNPLNIEDWRFTAEGEIHNNIELNTKETRDPVNIILSTDVCQPKPTSTTNSNKKQAVDKMPIDYDILDKKDVQNSLKKIRTHVRKVNQGKLKNKITLNKQSRKQMDQVPHYTISNRGSLQLILKSFLYNLHHKSSAGRKKRWRCIEYRKMHCQSYIDTDYDLVTAISSSHDHPNHDMQIEKKIRSNVIFTSLSNAMNTIHTLVNEDISSQSTPKIKKSKNK